MACRLIVGCGYVGRRVANRWLEQGDSVFAITRSNDRAIELNRLGIHPIIWDWQAEWSPNANHLLQPFTELRESKFATILIAVSHSPQPDLPPVETHTRGLRHLVNFLKRANWWDVEGNQTKWLYLSTSGVFEATQPGDWVDEDSPVLPDRPGSIAALAGEQWITDHIPTGLRVILRPVGIYGPDRVPRWESIRNGIPLQVDPESYLNLIQVDDLATTIVAVSLANMQSAMYCISDGHPVRRREYYEFISKIGRWPLPIFESRESQSAGRATSRSDSNKRVRNSRIQSELAVCLEYPSYREGLKSLLDQT